MVSAHRRRLIRRRQSTGFFFANEEVQFTWKSAKIYWQKSVKSVMICPYQIRNRKTCPNRLFQNRQIIRTIGERPELQNVARFIILKSITRRFQRMTMSVDVTKWRPDFDIPIIQRLFWNIKKGQKNEIYPSRVSLKDHSSYPSALVPETTLNYYYIGFSYPWRELIFSLQVTFPDPLTLLQIVLKWLKLVLNFSTKPNFAFYGLAIFCDLELLTKKSLLNKVAQSAVKP